MMAPLPPHVRDLRRVFLGQGEVLITQEPLVVQTTLGSCVSVALHDPVTKLSAMCHAVMPAAETGADLSLRYVDRAIEHLTGRFAAHGVPASRISAKVIGGSCGSLGAVQSPALQAVGPRNVDAAFEHLRRSGLEVVSRDTGGQHGRRVLFVTTTGDVYVRSLGQVRVARC